MKIGMMAIASPLEIPYMEEWIEWHRQIGIDEFLICLNDWNDEQRMELQSRIWRYLFDDKCVKMFRLDGKNMQLVAYNRMLVQAMKEGIDWCCAFDIDEFLRIRGDRTLGEILENFADSTSVAVNWRMYGSNGLEDVVNGDYSVVPRFRKCGRSLNHHVKQIVNVKKAVQQRNSFINPHCLEIPSIGIDGKGVFGLFNENGLDGAKELELAHYVVKSRQECRTRRTFRRADTGQVREEGWETFFKDNDINEIDDTEICFHKNDKYG